ncbi:MAG: dihydroneopterin aldolase [Deltaproteobacteria bacterium]|nr:dihydroneopterin aldolase [Deltaproteobacteria bacterium]
MDQIAIHNVRADCVIGDQPWERQQRQPIRCTLTLACDLRTVATSDHLTDTIDYVAVAETATTFLRQSSYAMLETLAAGLATHLLERFHPAQMTVTLWKQAHFPHADEVSVTVTRP